MTQATVTDMTPLWEFLIERIEGQLIPPSTSRIDAHWVEAFLTSRFDAIDDDELYDELLPLIEAMTQTEYTDWAQDLRDELAGGPPESGSCWSLGDADWIPGCDSIASHCESYPYN